MANRRGWWKIQYESSDELSLPRIELSDVDLEHIAELIVQGFTEGEIVQDDQPD